jgi:hypothetical protein
MYAANSSSLRPELPEHAGHERDAVRAARGTLLPRACARRPLGGTAFHLMASLFAARIPRRPGKVDLGHPPGKWRGHVLSATCDKNGPATLPSWNETPS